MVLIIVGVGYIERQAFDLRESILVSVKYNDDDNNKLALQSQEKKKKKKKKG